MFLLFTLNTNNTFLLDLIYYLFYQTMTHDDVLIGYKSSSSTDEEFLLCTTDKARQYIEETQKQVQKDLEQQVERSMNRLIGPWDSKGSEKDIEDVKPVTTREKVCLILNHFSLIYLDSLLEHPMCF